MGSPGWCGQCSLTCVQFDTSGFIGLEHDILARSLSVLSLWLKQMYVILLESSVFHMIVNVFDEVSENTHSICEGRKIFTQGILG